MKDNVQVIKINKIFKFLLMNLFILKLCSYYAMAGQELIINDDVVYSKADYVVTHSCAGNGDPVFRLLDRNYNRGHINKLNGDTSNNKITFLGQIGVEGNVYGAFAVVSMTDVLNISSNIVTLDITRNAGYNKTGKLTGNIFGGCAANAELNAEVANNKVELLNGEISENVLGGCSVGGQALRNELTMSGGTIIGAAYGGQSNGGQVVSNRLTISSGTVGSGFGGRSERGEVRENVLVMSGGAVQREASAGYSTEGQVLRNKLTMSGGTIVGAAYGGQSNGGQVVSNRLTISSGTVGSGFGGRSERGQVINNKVQILGGSIARRVLGGESRCGDVLENAVEVIDGVIYGDIIAGYSIESNANRNSVIIKGGKISGNIYAGKSDKGEAVDNIIEISGNPKFSKTTCMYGGYSAASAEDAFTGNIFNIKTNNIVIARMCGFETLRFYDVIKNQDPVVRCTVYKVDINNVKIKVELNVLEDADVGDKYLLIRSSNGFEGIVNPNTLVKQGALSRYAARVEIVNDIYLGIFLTREYTNPNAIIITQDKAITTEIISGGLDLIVDEGLESAKAASMVSKGMVPFSAFKAGRSKNNIDVKNSLSGLGLLGGLSKEIDGDGNKIMISGFVEYGNKKAELLEEIESAEISSWQTCNYTGAGLLSKVDLYNDAYIEGSVRIGNSKVACSTENLDPERGEITYDYDSMYIGCHAGIGCTYKINSKLSIDMNSKFLYMYYNKGILELSSGDIVDFPSLETGRLKLCSSAEYCTSKQWCPYIGLSYDYDVIGQKIEAITKDIWLPAVELNRGRFTGQIGVRKDIGKFSIDCGVMKYVGRIEGIDAMLKAKLYLGRDSIVLKRIRKKAEDVVEKKIKRKLGYVKNAGKIKISKTLQSIKKENKAVLKLKQELHENIENKTKS